MQTTVDIRELQERIERESSFVDALTMGMNQVIVGQKHLVESLLIGLLADGHILLLCELEQLCEEFLVHFPGLGGIFCVQIQRAIGHNGVDHPILGAQQTGSLDGTLHFLHPLLPVLYRSVSGRAAPGSVQLMDREAGSLCCCFFTNCQKRQTFF